VSDVWQGPGWWLASDGKWYSPDQIPGPVPATPAYPASGPTAPPGSVPTMDAAGDPTVPPAVTGDGLPGVPGSGPGASPCDAAWYPSSAPTYGPPPFSPGYGRSPTAPTYGPPPVTPGYGYQPGYPAYGYVPAARTNGLAIASLVCSLLWMFGVGGVLAIIFGFVARSQIKRSGDGQRGTGLALAGIIIGFAGVLAMALFIVLAVALDHHCHQPGNCTFTTPNTET